jgi:hypothetical protein
MCGMRFNRHANGCRYVYSLPGDFNTNLLDPDIPRFYDCKKSMYGAEVIIHEQLLARCVKFHCVVF